MGPRTSSRLLWAPTHRRFKSGPRAAPQAAQTKGACGTSALAMIGWERQTPFAPGCLPAGLPVFFSSGLPDFSGGAGGVLAPLPPSGLSEAGLSPSPRRYGSSLDGGRELVLESS